MTLQNSIEDCTRVLSRLGITLHATRLNYSSAEVVARKYDSDDERWRAWYAESLLHGLRAVESKDYVMVFRCYVQAVEYKAKGKIVDVQEGTERAHFDLRREIEEVLRRVETLMVG